MATELTACVAAFQQLEADRARVLAWLAEWPSACVSFRPSPGAWSAPEVLEHIVLAETGTIVDVRASLRNPQILSGMDRPNVAALDRALRSDQCFRVPTDAAIYPDAQTALPDVVSRWEQGRIELHSLLKELKPADADCGVFCHPFAGWMTFREVLEHFDAHLYHHEFQLKRLQTRWRELHA